MPQQPTVLQRRPRFRAQGKSTDMQRRLLRRPVQQLPAGALQLQSRRMPPLLPLQVRLRLLCHRQCFREPLMELPMQTTAGEAATLVALLLVAAVCWALEVAVGRWARACAQLSTPSSSAGEAAALVPVPLRVSEAREVLLVPLHLHLCSVLLSPALTTQAALAGLAW